MLSNFSQRLRVHQYHDSAQALDAVTNQMRFVRETLSAIGIGGEIFARHIKPPKWTEVRPFSANAIWDCDLLLIHHSQGSPLLPEVLKIEVPKALVYHNITPAKYFKHDPYIQNLCEMGKNQLLRLRSEVIASYADSRFNGWELENLGYGRPKILPLFAMEKVEVPLRAHRAPKRFLFVGKITPHKNQALLVKSLFYLKTLLGKKTHVFLVGGEDPIYGRYLRGLVAALGLIENVTFTGKIGRENLAEQYELADAFVSTSLHEGFGIPLIEAMRAGTPVFALPCGAIPETLGTAGVLLKSRRPHRIAEVLAAVLKDAVAVQTVRQSQQVRLNELAEEQSTANVQERILHLLGTLRKIPTLQPLPSSQPDATP